MCRSLHPASSRAPLHGKRACNAPAIGRLRRPERVMCRSALRFASPLTNVWCVRSALSRRLRLRLSHDGAKLAALRPDACACAREWRNPRGSGWRRRGVVADTDPTYRRPFVSGANRRASPSPARRDCRGPAVEYCKGDQDLEELLGSDQPPPARANAAKAFLPMTFAVPHPLGVAGRRGQKRLRRRASVTASMRDETPSFWKIRLT
jgi:hypothetical protein